MPSKASPTVAGPTLTLPELSFDDEGIYECEAYNSEGSDTYQGRINVQGDRKLLIVQQSTFFVSDVISLLCYFVISVHFISVLYAFYCLCPAPPYQLSQNGCR